MFHKIITNGHQRLQPLFDCLLTIIVNGKSAVTADAANNNNNNSNNNNNNNNNKLY